MRPCCWRSSPGSPGSGEASLSEAIGWRGLLVHAESEHARSFYEDLIPEWGSPGFVDTDQEFTGVSVGQAMSCCS